MQDEKSTLTKKWSKINYFLLAEMSLKAVHPMQPEIKCNIPDTEATKKNRQIADVKHFPQNWTTHLT